MEISQNSFVQNLEEAEKKIDKKLKALKIKPDLPKRDDFKQFDYEYDEFNQELGKIASSFQELAKNLQNVHVSQNDLGKLEEKFRLFIQMSSQVEQALQIMQILALSPQDAQFKKSKIDALSEPRKSFQIIRQNFANQTTINPSISGENGSIAKFISEARSIAPKHQMLNLIGIRTKSKNFRSALKNHLAGRSSPTQAIDHKFLTLPTQAIDHKFLTLPAPQRILSPNIARFQREVYKQFKDSLIIGYATYISGEKIGLSRATNAQISEMLSSQIPVLSKFLTPILSVINDYRDGKRAEKYQDFAHYLDNVSQVRRHNENGDDFLALHEKVQIAKTFAASVAAEYQEELKKTAKNFKVQTLAREVISRLRKKLPEITKNEISKDQFIAASVTSVTSQNKKSGAEIVIDAALNPVRNIKKSIRGTDATLSKPSKTQEFSAQELEASVKVEPSAQYDVSIEKVLSLIKNDNKTTLGRTIFQTNKMRNILKEATVARLKNARFKMSQTWDKYVKPKDFEKMLDLYRNPRARLFSIKTESNVSGYTSKALNHFRGYTSAVLSKLYSKHISRKLTTKRIQQVKDKLKQYVSENLNVEIQHSISSNILVVSEKNTINRDNQKQEKIKY